MNKLKTMLLSVCTLCSVSLFAQSEKTKNESVIVMTQAELNSFLSTIAEARRSQLKARDAKESKQQLDKLRLKYKERSGDQWQTEPDSRFDQISNQQILNELRYLNQRIDNLGSNANRAPYSGRDNSTIIVPGTSNATPSYGQSDRSTTTVLPNNTAKIKKLQNEIDSLRNASIISANYQKDNSLVDSLSSMSGRLQNVRRHLDSLESKMAFSGNSKTEGVILEDKTPSGEKLYFKQQVFFDNNSEVLKGDYLPNIEYLIQILNKYPETKIMLEGWASPVGKPSYNKMLSMRRAESVEKAFINNRIDSSRIITSFRGEDKSSSEQHARRVDMSIIVR